MTKCRFCGSEMPHFPLPTPEEHSTHCKVLRARKGVIVPCSHPIEGSLQLGCNWPGKDRCPVSAAFDKEKP